MHIVNTTGINVGGYKDSGMRKYLVEVDGAGGNFLTGLKNAGVPESVLWAPSRRVWNGFLSNPGPQSTVADSIEDVLFLPTEREMFGSNTHSNGSYETDANQGRLEYYASGALRMKYDSSNTGALYWLASPLSSSADKFVSVFSDGTTNNTNTANLVYGCAPAFCVK